MPGLPGPQAAARGSLLEVARPHAPRTLSDALREAARPFDGNRRPRGRLARRRARLRFHPEPPALPRRGGPGIPPARPAVAYAVRRGGRTGRSEERRVGKEGR